MSSLVVDEETQIEGRELTPQVGLLLVILAGLSGFVGLLLFVGPGWTEQIFVWQVASPLTAGLLGAGFLGAVPMMLTATVRSTWEQVRIAVIPALVLTAGMFAVTVMHMDETRVGGGPLLAYLLSLGWTAAMCLLPIALAGAIFLQYTEPGLPMDKRAPIPRFVIPALAIEAVSGLGLGLALLVEPEWWLPILPFDASVVDARALGVWALVLGLALLQATAEDDLDRLVPGLFGVLAIGVLGLAAIIWHRAEITWDGWAAVATVAFVAGLVLTGALGLVLRRWALAHDSLS